MRRKKLEESETEEKVEKRECVQKKPWSLIWWRFYYEVWHESPSSELQFTDIYLPNLSLPSLGLRRRGKGRNTGLPFWPFQGHVTFNYYGLGPTTAIIYELRGKTTTSIPQHVTLVPLLLYVSLSYAYTLLSHPSH